MLPRDRKDPIVLSSDRTCRNPGLVAPCVWASWFEGQGWGRSSRALPSGSCPEEGGPAVGGWTLTQEASDGVRLCRGSGEKDSWRRGPR